MKKLIFILLLLSSQFSFGGNLTALFSYCSFNQPSEKPFVETYLHIKGGSAQLTKNSAGKLQAKVEVQMIIKSDTNIVYFDKFNMISPQLDPTDSIVPDFIDQHRVALGNGTYMLELKIKDKNSADKELSLKQELKISFPKDEVSVSDIEYLESYEKSTDPNPYFKSGFNVVPYDFYFFNITAFFCSVRIYNQVRNVTIITLF